MTKSGKTREAEATLLLGLAALLAFFTWAPPAGRGALGAFLKQLLNGLFGTGAMGLPVLLGLFSMELFLEKKEKRSREREGLVLLLFLCLETGAGLRTLELSMVENLSVSEAFTALWNGSLLSDSFLNPGVVGGLLSLSFMRVLGKTGSYILVWGMGLAVAVLIFDLSWKQLGKKTPDAVVKTGAKMGEMGRQVRVHRASVKEEKAMRQEERRKEEERALEAEERVEREEEKMPVYRSEFSLESLENVGGNWAVEDAEDGMPGWQPLSEAEFGAAPVKEPPAIRPVYLEEEFGVYPERKRQRAEGNVPEYVREERPEPVPQPEPEPIPEPVPEPEPEPEVEAEKPAEKEKLSSIADRIEEDTESVQKTSSREDWEDRAKEQEPEKKVFRQSELPYAPPPLELLKEDPVQGTSEEQKEEIRLLGAKLEKTLENFGVDARVVNFVTGPTISRFELKPGPGVKVSKIVGLSDDIALALAATGLRIEAPIPGKSAIGIEIPNRKTRPVLLRGIIESEKFRKETSPMCAALGRDIQGGEMLCDISSMPHLLIAGATGSGKSVCINAILISLLYRSSPRDLRMLMIDPKVVELSIYNGIPHLLQPVVTDPKKAYAALDWAVQEMERRYNLFAKHTVRDFRAYNELVDSGELPDGEHLPLILLVIDELSDLMATTPGEVEAAIGRLTAMARAAGIHLIIATQRPSVDVITGVIKANIPSRIAFSVASATDSRTILDMGGAEKLLGRGDMLYNPQSAAKPLRGQGAFVTDAEVERVIDYLKSNYPENYSEAVGEAIEKVTAGPEDEASGGSSAEEEEDELLYDALQIVVESGRASVSFLQRQLSIGYPRAGRIVDSLAAHGWIGPHEGSKPRKVLITEDEYEQLMEELYTEN